MPMVDILVPQEQEGTKAVIRSWLRQVGDTVAENDPLVELETDKVTQEIPAPVAGVLSEILLDMDAEALPGMVLGRIAPAVSELAVSEPAVPEPAMAGPDADAPEGAGAAVPDTGLSPAVRQAVRQHGIDPATIPGTGRGGRLTRADVDRAATERAVTAPAQDRGHGGVRVVPHDRMRLAIAQNMLQSVTVAPHVTAVFECDFSAISAHRRRNKGSFERAGANLTFTSYLIAASVQAMAVAPAVNSRWFEDRLEIHDDVSVGVGTALGEKGLVVPVVHHAQELSLIGIAGRLSDLTARARAGTLTPADMRGGTFTLSNHGVSGSLLATPIIIAQPQSAILGIGRLEKRVVVREVDGIDTIQIRPMCYVSLTIDHRVIDGQQTNAWLSRFVQVLEGWPLAD